MEFLDEYSELFEAEVLRRLDPADRAVLAQVGWPWLAAVVRAAGARRRAGAYSHSRISSSGAISVS
jgi:hypothetical protein